MNRRLVFGVVAVTGLALLTAAWAAPGPPPPQPLTARLLRAVKFDGIVDGRATLGDTLDRLAKQYDLTFDVNEKAFTEDSVQDVLKTDITQPGPLPPMKNVRLATVLRKVLSRVPAGSGATWTLRDDRIEITTGQAQIAEVWGDYPGPYLPLVWATLDKVPLEDALKDLAEQTDFNVVLDNRAGEKGKTPVTARLRNTPLDTALRLLSDMADLRSVHLDNVLYVTTKENAAAMEARLERERKGPDPLNPTDEGNPPRVRKGSGPSPVPGKPKGAAGAM
jgi:hypothetical protein